MKINAKFEQDPCGDELSGLQLRVLRRAYFDADAETRPRNASEEAAALVLVGRGLGVWRGDVFEIDELGNAVVENRESRRQREKELDGEAVS